MPTYRTLEPVSLVKDGKVLSLKADREIELAEEDAASLAGKIVLLKDDVRSMFPNGAPVVSPHIVREHAARRIAGVPVEPEAKTVAAPVARADKPAVKTDVKADAK